MLRQEVVWQREELRAVRGDLEVQRQRNEALAAQVVDNMGCDRDSLIEEVTRACSTLTSTLVGPLAQRVSQMVQGEREARITEVADLREALEAVVKERIARAVREERTARLEELSEMHRALAALVDKEHDARTKDMSLLLPVLHGCCRGLDPQNDGAKQCSDKESVGQLLWQLCQRVERAEAKLDTFLQPQRLAAQFQDRSEKSRVLACSSSSNEDTRDDSEPDRGAGSATLSPKACCRCAQVAQDVAEVRAHVAALRIRTSLHPTGEKHGVIRVSEAGVEES